MRWLSPLRLHPIIPTLLLTGLSLVACRGGGGTTTPDPNRESASAPSISDVRLISGVPMSGETVQLKASATNLVTRWNWDFGTGATPPTSQEAEPSVQLLAAGRHTGQVWATNGFGTSKPFIFPYSIAPAIAPVALPISANSLWMSTGKITRFTLAVSPDGGLPTAYEWIADGGQLVGPTINSVVAFRATQPGTFFSSVHASNAYGQTESVFPYTVIQAPDIDAVEISNVGLSRGAYVLSPSFSIFGGAHRKELTWDFPNGGSTRGFYDEHNDYYERDDDLFVTVITGDRARLSGSVRICEWDWNCDTEYIDEPVPPQPTGPNWVSSPASHPGVSILNAASLALIDDRPAVLFRENGQATAGSLVFSQALTAEPRRTGDWMTHEVFDFPGPGAPGFQLFSRSGHPFIACGTDLFEATSAVPTTAADWQHRIFDPMAKKRSLTIAPSGEIWVAVFDEDDDLAVHRFPAGADLESDAWSSYPIPLLNGPTSARIAVCRQRPVMIGGRQSEYPFLHCVASTRESPRSADDWINYELKTPEWGSIKRSFVDVRGDETQLLVSHVLISGPHQPRPALLRTSDPAAGLSAWELVEGARVDWVDRSALRHHVFWKGRPLQIDTTFSAMPPTLLVSRSDAPSPHQPEDWFITMPEPLLGMPAYGAVVASDSHLYVLGIQGETTPTLLWTTEQF